MALRLEDYAVVGDRRTAAVIGRDGSVDWLCLPRFDADPCLSALLGSDDAWSLGPAGTAVPAGRRYREGTMVLETDLAGDNGLLRITDCMPFGDTPALVRELRAVGGPVEVESTVRLGFSFGQRQPWWRDRGGRLEALAGPDAVVLDGDVRHRVRDGAARASFVVRPGQPVCLRLAWHGWDRSPPAGDLSRSVAETARWWRRWLARSTYDGPYPEAVGRSLLVLKALSHRDTGGIVAAVTTSLPEQLGGTRNWDYRFCWLRDATFTLLALLESGYRDEAKAWREWLLRSVAGDPHQVQVVYGLGGETDLTERVRPLPGYAGSSPVRSGNAASGQVQLDVYGEVVDAFYQAREHELVPDDDAWRLERGLLEALESRWDEPDRGIWEVRGDPQHFVHSKVMAWVAVDRAVRTVEAVGLPGDTERWKALRSAIHAEVCERGFDPDRGTFVQAYGSRGLDAAVLKIPAVGFLPPRDPRVLGTIQAVERELSWDGLLRRYDDDRVDGLPQGEGCFLPCTFWLADAHALAGRRARARELYERLLSLRNDVGLLTEEYDVERGRALGNLPQALTHVPVVNTAHLLTGGGASRTRSRR